MPQVMLDDLKLFGKISLFQQRFQKFFLVATLRPLSHKVGIFVHNEVKHLTRAWYPTPCGPWDSEASRPKIEPYLHPSFAEFGARRSRFKAIRWLRSPSSVESDGLGRRENKLCKYFHDLITIVAVARSSKVFPSLFDSLVSRRLVRIGYGTGYER